MKHIFLTGGTRGIGAAIAARLSDHKVIGTGSADGDLSDPATPARLWSSALERLDGRIDILINNAGVFEAAPIDLPDADWSASWNRTMQINLTASAELCRFAVRHFDANGGGRIVNIASQAAKTGFPHLPAYVSSKHGMIGLTRASAVELGAHNITVNAVCPNHVTTGLGAQQNEYFSKLLGFDSVDAYVKNMASKNPMGRPGLPSDTAAACAWLASNDAYYVTGEALNVSGGEETH